MPDYSGELHWLICYEGEEIMGEMLKHCVGNGSYGGSRGRDGRLGRLSGVLCVDVSEDRRVGSWVE